ncbi:MAG: putative hydro-lyase [Deltaproteobacteria bacterium]|nr:putative hydro-lyase [Deltaproteobacteria bacterium]
MEIKPSTQGTPAQVRARIARGEITGPTAELCPGFGQANLVIVPRDWAFDFLLFALRNPRSCPLVEVLDPGDPFTRVTADHADLRREIPRYRVWEKGKLKAEPTDITPWWRDGLVSFLLGCSFSFDAALMAAGLPVRHVEAGCNVPMYRTSVPARPAGRLGGPLVVSMRPMPPELVEKAHAVSGRFTSSHGAPVHHGDAGALGIADLAAPHYGDAVEVRPGEVPVFWACGVTPQAVLVESGVDFAITHAPGHMFITDLPAGEMAAVGPGAAPAAAAAPDRP